MNEADADYIKIGKIGSTYGIKGWLKIQSFTEFEASILDYSPWYLSNETNGWDPIVIEEGKPHGKGVVAKFSGVNTPEEAKLLTGRMIAIHRDQLPVLKEDEYYWSDLVGLTVINKHGDTLGKVVYIMETGSNDVLVIKGEKEHAIPFLRGTVILSVDLLKKEIHVDWELI